MGVFQYEDDLIRAARQLKESGFEGMSFLSPVPIEHSLENAEPQAEGFLGLGAGGLTA